jgi:polyvinyl alcohol dehydrogenase (cytochrome)
VRRGPSFEVIRRPLDKTDEDIMSSVVIIRRRNGCIAHQNSDRRKVEPFLILAGLTMSASAIPEFTRRHPVSRHINRSSFVIVLSACAALGVLGAGREAHGQTTPPSWSFAGADLYNSHAQLSPQANITTPTQINPSTASSLKLLWSFATKGDISATPTVEPGGLYVPDWAGMLYKINPATGALIWSQSISTYTGLPGQSRSSPAIGSTVIVIGDQEAHSSGPNPGARVIAVNKTTGALAWVTIVDSDPYSEVMGSPVIDGDLVYVGTASWDEGEAGANPDYTPTFRGSMTALNISTGAIVWKFYTVPTGYTGGSVPGSSPVVWNNSLIFGTGNNYSVPAAVEPCVKAAGSNWTAQVACLASTDYVDSLISLNLTTGALIWSRRMSGADAWNIGCDYGYPNCPNPPGNDTDFASAPNLTWLPNFVGVSDDRGGTSASYLLGAGQKNSMYWALNPADGGLFWSTNIGIGGIEWGSALDLDDSNMVFVSLNNPEHVSNTLAGRNGVPVKWNGGAWGALNITTGKMVWQIPAYGQDLVTPSSPSSAPGSLTFTNRVVFAGSSSGYFVALNANTGLTYWTFNSHGTVVSSPAIFNETVYWGTGYARNGVGYHMLYAFSVP